MPIPLPASAPTLLIRRDAFERAGLARAELDQRFNLTADEFRVEQGLIAVGPLFGDDAVELMVAWLEERGLSYFDDFFELSGNWPEWLGVWVMG